MIGVITLQYKTKTLSPRWLEQFDLYMYDDQTNQLEITVFDHDVSGRDDFMGRYARSTFMRPFLYFR